MEFAVVGTLALSGFFSAISVYVMLLLACKGIEHGLQKMLGYHLWIDGTFTIAMMIAFAGTFSGMITAFAGGFTLTILLLVTKLIVGYGKWYWKWGWRFFPGVW